MALDSPGAWTKKNVLADWVPYFAYSLNLVGHCAVDCIPSVTEFFDFIKRLYTFFSAATRRWDILLNELLGTKLPVVKRLFDTRRSAHSPATSALKQRYKNVHAALVSISEDTNEEARTRLEATGLLKKMEQLENCILLELWSSVLKRFHMMSMKLQSTNLDLNEAVILSEPLKKYMTSLRDSFHDFDKKGIVGDWFPCVTCVEHCREIWGVGFSEHSQCKTLLSTTVIKFLKRK